MPLDFTYISSFLSQVNVRIKSMGEGKGLEFGLRGEGEGLRFECGLSFVSCGCCVAELF